MHFNDNNLSIYLPTISHKFINSLAKIKSDKIHKKSFKADLKYRYYFNSYQNIEFFAILHGNVKLQSNQNKNILKQTK